MELKKAKEIIDNEIDYMHFAGLNLREKIYQRLQDNIKKMEMTEAIIDALNCLDDYNIELQQSKNHLKIAKEILNSEIIIKEMTEKIGGLK